ncbi:MAG TPA: STAS domain-containing protein [Gammaproteobacteria bacterium]|nr:STAS domain-containing protein [Gammaproteobacteria bacterium]
MPARVSCEGRRLALSGELGFDSVPGVWAECRGYVRAGGELDVDLAGIERADSAGLALLVEWLRDAEAAGTRLRFLNMPEQMQAMARVSGLDEILPLD